MTTSRTSQPEPPKKQKNPPRENVLYFRNWKHRKHFLIFFRNKAVLMFQDVTFRARKMKKPVHFYIPGNETFQRKA